MVVGSTQRRGTVPYAAKMPMSTTSPEVVERMTRRPTLVRGERIRTARQNDRRLLCRMVVTSRAVPDAGPARVRIDRPPVRWSADERGILDDSESSNRLQNVYSARDIRELASTYDEWAQDYEDDMLSLGYAIPAVAAGFVGATSHSGGPCWMPVQVPVCSEASCVCSATKTSWG